MSSTGPLRADAERNIRAIVEAAITLLAAEPDASMERVASAAGVGRATVYRHFVSREQLVRAIHEQALVEAREAVLSSRPDEGPALEALQRVVGAVLAVADRFRLVRQIPRQDRELRARAEEVGVLLVALFERGQASGELRSDLKPRWMAAVFGSLVQASTAALVNGDIRERQAERLVLTTLVDGLRRRD